MGTDDHNSRVEWRSAIDGEKLDVRLFGTSVTLYDPDWRMGGMRPAVATVSTAFYEKNDEDPRDTAIPLLIRQLEAMLCKLREAPTMTPPPPDSALVEQSPLPECFARGFF